MTTATNKIAPLASKISELSASIKEGETVKIAVRNGIVAAAKRLIDTVSVPEEQALQRSANAMEIVAIRAAIKLGVLQHLPSDGTITIEELSQKTGAQAELLQRMLRLLVGTGFINQAADGSYSHSSFSNGCLGSPGDWISFL